MERVLLGVPTGVAVGSTRRTDAAGLRKPRTRQIRGELIVDGGMEAGFLTRSTPGGVGGFEIGCRSRKTNEQLNCNIRVRGCSNRISSLRVAGGTTSRR